jgi:peptidoglycan hydrolase CwlO-like protein
VKYLEEVNQTKIAVSDLEGKLNQLGKFGAEQNSLILAVEKTVSEKLNEVGGEVREHAGKFRDEIRNMSEFTINFPAKCFKITFREGYDQ